MTKKVKLGFTCCFRRSPTRSRERHALLSSFTPKARLLNPTDKPDILLMRKRLKIDSLDKHWGHNFDA
ncbi:hypothetical protein VNO78_25092 [Psophocarpus tetragonolobus]|uniref:Uncharacterized protein n=1 Tax=Psophocarpus tetragonolobus TaxID=3891 RepID=A0AAN9S5T7_PSOTE